MAGGVILKRGRETFTDHLSFSEGQIIGIPKLGSRILCGGLGLELRGWMPGFRRGLGGLERFVGSCHV